MQSYRGKIDSVIRAMPFRHRPAYYKDVPLLTMTDTNSAILSVAVISNTLLGACVWRTRRRSLSAQIFLAMVALIILWTIANYLIDTSTTGAEALLWTRSLFVLALGYIYLFYIFARIFARVPLPSITFYDICISLVLFGSVVITLGSGLVFSDASLGTAGLSDLQFGLLYLPISVFGLFVAGSGVSALISTARHAGRTVVRDQAVLIIAGWIMFLGLVIMFAAILPYFIPALVNASKIAPLFSIIMVGCSAYAIARHRFLDVTPIIRRGLVYSLLLGTILSFYLLLLFILAYLVRINSDTLEFAAGALTVIVGIFGAPSIEAYFQKLTDQLFFKDTYEYADALEELSSILNTNVRIPQLIGRSLYTLNHILKPERIEFQYAQNAKRYDMSGDEALPFESLLPGEDGLIIPVCTDRQLIGELFLWPKRSGDLYGKEDQALLRTFASHATIALQKAELYEQLKQYSDQLEDRVRDRTRHLEDLRTSQREFMDDVSHALQTPLTVLTSTMELLMKEFPPEQNRHFLTASHSMDELTRLIRNLLALARVEALPDTDESARFNVSEVMEHLVEYVGVICTNAGITLHADIAPEIYLDANQAQIEEAVTNLLSNAVRYSSDSPIRNIYVRLMQNGPEVEISIQDTGIGIHADRVPHIFERFYRAQDALGSGIGLAITKKIIERHGGSIAVQSELGTGTIMTVRF